MSCAGEKVVPPSTLTASVGEPPLCPARAISTTSPEEVKLTVFVATAVLFVNLSAWPFEYVVPLTTDVPVGRTSIASPSTGGGRSAASAVATNGNRGRNGASRR